jgi:probable F420-dependent oxidoreductase
MRIGVVFPQTEISADPGAVKDYAHAVEALGYAHISAYDHVLGANTASRPGQRFPYDHESNFHEPMVLFGYLAALTSRVELVTSIVILPQRQTALVAKQAAAIDVLSRGRLRLGVGLGWNTVEYESLGADFHTRGKRVEEQIAVMRRLWTEPLVTIETDDHRIIDAGLSPLPVQRPIPVWMGGTVDAALRRIAKVADGWFPMVPADQAAGTVSQMRDYVREAGRDPGGFGLEARFDPAAGDRSEIGRHAETWRAAGATHLSINTMRRGLESPSAHMRWLRDVAEDLGLA